MAYTLTEKEKRALAGAYQTAVDQRNAGYSPNQTTLSSDAGSYSELLRQQEAARKAAYNARISALGARNTLQTKYNSLVDRVNSASKKYKTDYGKSKSNYRSINSSKNEFASISKEIDDMLAELDGYDLDEAGKKEFAAMLQELQAATKEVSLDARSRASAYTNPATQRIMQQADEQLFTARQLENYERALQSMPNRLTTQALANAPYVYGGLTPGAANAKMEEMPEGDAKEAVRTWLQGPNGQMLGDAALEAEIERLKGIDIGTAIRAVQQSIDELDAKAQEAEQYWNNQAWMIEGNTEAPDYEAYGDILARLDKYRGILSKLLAEQLENEMDAYKISGDTARKYLSQNYNATNLYDRVNKAQFDTTVDFGVDIDLPEEVKTSGYPIAQRPEAYMTERERDTFNRLWAQKGEKAATEYFELIEPELKERGAQIVQQEAERFAKDFPIWAGIQRIGAKPLEGIAAIPTVINPLIGKPINENDAVYQLTQVNKIIDTTVPETTNWTGNLKIGSRDADSLIYGTITSVADSIVRTALGSVLGGAGTGASQAENAKSLARTTSALMGMEMLPAAVIEEKEKGRSDREALAIGGLRAAIEAITEKYSIEAIFSPTKNFGTALLKGMAAEGSEEMAATILNGALDVVVGDENSILEEWNRRKAMGADPASSLVDILVERGKETLIDGVMGAISGAVFSAGGYATGAIEQREKIQNAYGADDYSELIAEARELNPASKTLERAEALQEKGKKITPRLAGKLIEENNTAVAEIENSANKESILQPTESGTQNINTKLATEQVGRKNGAETTVRRVAAVNDYGVTVETAEGKKVNLSKVDKRGTALEVLDQIEALGEYADLQTANGLYQSYRHYLQVSEKQSTEYLAQLYAQTYSMALNDGISGVSRSETLGISTDKYLQGALNSAYDRGAEIAQGRAAAAQMGPSGQAAFAEYGYRDPELFSKFYRAGQQGASWQEAMKAAGAMRLGETRKAEMQAALRAGREDGTNFETTENEEWYAVSDESSQRARGVGTRGEAGSMEEGAGGRQKRDGGRQQPRGQGDEAARTSLKTLGVTSGSDAAQTVVARERNDYGGEVITVSDPLAVLDKSGKTQTVRGIQTGRNVILYANDPMYEQHKKHELEHLRQRSMTDEEIEIMFREKTKDLTDSKLREILSAYALDYYGLYGTEMDLADLYREYLADEAAGIEHKKSAVDSLLRKIEQRERSENRIGERFLAGEKQDLRELVVKLKEHIAEIRELDPVARMSGNEFETVPGKTLTDQVVETYKKFGMRVTRPGFGDVLFSKSKIKGDIVGHGVGRAKAVTFAAVPDVIRQGKQIDFQDNWKGRGYDSYVFAAPAKIGNDTVCIAATVIRDNENRFYLHEVVDENGNLIKIINAPDQIKTGAETADSTSGSETLSVSSIRDKNRVDNSNINEKFSLSAPQSSANYTELQAYMAKQTFEIRRQMQEGTAKKPTQASVAQAAGEILRGVGNQAMTQQELQERLATIALIPSRTTDTLRAYAEMKTASDTLAGELIRNASGKTDKAVQEWDALRRAFRPNGKAVKLVLESADRANLKDAGGYEYLRKHNMGTFFLSASGTDMGTFYGQLAEQFPQYFPADVTDAAQQLILVNDVLDSFRSIFKAPFEGNMATATNMLSQEILQKLYNRMAPTGTQADFAQQHEDMLHAYFRTALQETHAEHQRRLEKFKEEHERRKEQARNARQERADRAALLNVGRRLDRMPGKISTELSAELVTQLNEIAERMLGRSIVKDDPNAAADAAQEILEKIDWQGQRAPKQTTVGAWIGNASTAEIEGEYNLDGKKIIDISALESFVREQRASNPDFNPDNDTLKKLSRLDKLHIEEMNTGDVRTLLNVLRHLENEIQTNKKLIATQEKREIYALTNDVVNNLRSMKPVGVTGVSGFVRRNVTENTLAPITFFNRVTGHKATDPLMQRAQEMLKGEEESISFTMWAEKTLEAFHEDSRFMDSIRGKNAKRITINARTANGIQKIEITPAMRIALYLHAKNNDNLRHIEYGGIRIPDLDLMEKGKRADAFSRGILAKFTRSEMNRITQDMSEREIAYAKTIEKYYATAAQRINEVSTHLLGYEKANIRNYFPIHVSQEYRQNATPETIKMDVSIEGAGFLQQRSGASNPIDMWDVTDTVMGSIKQNAKYIGLAIPVRNMAKLYGNTNWSIASDVNDETADQRPSAMVTSISAELGRVWGKSAADYIDKLMGDIQTRTAPGEDAEKFFNKVRSNYAQAVLTMNPSVTMKQFSAYPVAASVIGWKPLQEGLKLNKKVDAALIEKYSPWLWYRSQGSLERELGDLAKGKRHLPKWADWINATDALVVKRLWLASESYIRDTRKDLKVNTDDYYRAVAEIFGEIIQKTQPDNAIMHRPQAIRSTNALWRQFNMFKSQAYLVFNSAYDSIQNMSDQKRHLQAAQEKAEQEQKNGELTAETKQELADAEKAVKDAKTGIARTFSGLVASEIVTSAIAILYNLLRGKKEEYEDEEGKLSWLQMLKATGKNLLSAGAGSMVWGSQIYDFIAGLPEDQIYYGFEASSVSTVNDLLTSVKKLYNSVDEIFDDKADPGLDMWRLGESFLSTAAKVVGVPWDNIRNIGRIGLLNTLSAMLPEEEAEYWYRRVTTQTGKSGRKDADYGAIYDALMRGDGKSYETMREQVETYIWQTNKNYQGGEIMKEEAIQKAAESVDEAMQSRVKSDFSAGALTEAEAIELLVKFGKGENEAYFILAGLDGDKKYDKLQEAVLSAGDVEGERKKLTDHGVSEETVAEKIRAAIRAGYQQKPDEDGNPYTGNTVNAKQAAKLLTDHLGTDPEEAEKIVQKWTMYRETGYEYDEVKNLYLDGTISEEEAIGYLVTYGGKDENDAYWAIQNAGTDSTSVYNNLSEALQSGSGIQEAIDELTKHGKNEKAVQSEICTFAKAWYIAADPEDGAYDGPVISEREAKEIITQYGGKSSDEADQTLKEWVFIKENGWDYDSRAALYKDGEISKTELRTALTSYGGMSGEEADVQIQVYDLQMQGYENANPSNMEDYNEFCAAVNVPVDVYFEILDLTSDIVNDKDENGKSISNSAKNKKMDVINAYPLTVAQKDALYFANGWASSKLYQAPWH